MPKPTSQSKASQTLIFSERSCRSYPLEVRLKQEGFKLAAAESLELFAQTWKRQTPDAVIIRSNQNPKDIISILRYLSRKAINVSSVPTFLQVKPNIVQFLAPLIELGIEEISELEGSIDALITKIKSACNGENGGQRKPDRVPRAQSGSRGSLADMSIVDLLQAMGPSQRTIRITVRPDDPSAGVLTMYLVRGNITYAKLGDLLAEKAIYRALEWQTGSWTLESLPEQDFPTANNTLPNEFILMEGCRLIDENGREAVATESCATTK